MKRATFWAPLMAAAFGVVWFLVAMRPAADGTMHLSRFGTLATFDQGRYKPIDTVTRYRLLAMNRNQTYHDEFNKRQPAVQWLLDLMAVGYAQEQLAAPLEVTDPEVLAWFGARPDRRHDLRELMKGRNQAERVMSLERKSLDQLAPVERKVVALLDTIRQRQSIRDSILDRLEKTGSPARARTFCIDNDQVLAILHLEPRKHHGYSYADIHENGKYYEQFFKTARGAFLRPEKERDLVDIKSLELMTHLKAFEDIMRLEGVPLVPGTDGWLTLRESRMSDHERDSPAAFRMERIIASYATGDSKAFNREVEAHARWLDENLPAGVTEKVRLESWFNQFAPFYQCALLYVVVLLLAIGSWVVWHEPLRRAAFSLAMVVWAMHTLALGVRMYLTGRPPVIDLYSSAVWIGWGSVLLCLILECLTRRNHVPGSIGVTVAAVLGFLTMIVAHHLGGSGDTMAVLQAVLDTNFWLATHVTTITLGYTATFVAGCLAIVFVFRVLATAAWSYLAGSEPVPRSDRVILIASVGGLMALPGMLLVALMGGLWILATNEPPDGGTLSIFCLLVFAPLAVCTAMVCIRRLSDEARPMPTILRFTERFVLTTSASKSLSGVVYGVICFATLLSFFGTVLGGIWADQSWGRFWGWDPKENGALLIVVTNALILHARWSGMIRERGMCALAILGNMVTVWSYFGTNQLGVGLHAYGFNRSLAFGCAVFWVSQLCLVGLALVPIRFWRSPMPSPLPATAPGWTSPDS